MKNTVMLYFRTLVLMFISFYTSRVVLNALGVENFGVYNVVGGVVGMLAFINSSMTLATNRYLSYALGKQDISLLRKTYSTSVNIHVCIAAIVVLLSETIGLWYFNNFMKIPSASIKDAIWVYQLSVIGAAIGICNVPNMSLITAHEDMSAYAYISIVEGALKLIVAFLLSIPMLDNIKAYALLMFGVSCTIRGIWITFSRRKYSYCKYSFGLERKLLKEMTSFVGWQMFGSISWILRNQGANLMLNYFFGPVLNTARALSLQINGGITSLFYTFLAATNPQIVKNYAAGDKMAMHILIFRSSKMSFMLLLLFALPVLFEIEPILQFWLGKIPEYAVVFARLTIIATLLDSLSGTMQQGALATGKIRVYTQVVTTIYLSYLAFVYLFYKLGYPPQSMLYVEMGIYMVALIARLFISRKLHSMSVRLFIRKVLLPEFYVVVLSLILIIGIVTTGLANHLHVIFRLAMYCGVTIACIWVIGLNHTERTWLASLLKSKLCIRQ